MERTAKAWFVAALVSLLLAGPRLAADEPPERKVESAELAGGDTAIVDVAAVFAGHDGYRLRTRALRVEVLAVGRELAERNAEIRKLEQEKQLIEMKLAERKASFDEFKNRYRAEFIDTEAGIYHDVYHEILAEVNLYAREHGLRLVLNASPSTLSNWEPSEIPTRQEVLKRVGALLYAAQQFDITEEILERVNRPEKP